MLFWQAKVKVLVFKEDTRKKKQKKLYFGELWLELWLKTKKKRLLFDSCSLTTAYARNSSKKALFLSAVGKSL